MKQEILTHRALLQPLITKMMFSSLTLTALLASYASASSLKVTGNGYINYTTVTGYFLQDEPTTNASTFNYVRIPLKS